MSIFKRGDIISVDLSNSKGSVQSNNGRHARICVVISNEKNNMHSPTINILPLTDSRNEKSTLPVHAIIKAIKDSTVLCEQITTVDIAEQVVSDKPLLTLSKSDMRAIDRCLVTQLALEDEVERRAQQKLGMIAESQKYQEYEPKFYTREKLAIELRDTNKAVISKRYDNWRSLAKSLISGVTYQKLAYDIKEFDDKYIIIIGGAK